MMTRLETQRLTLRKPEPSDWPAFKEFAMSDRAAGIGGPMTHRVAFRQFGCELGHWNYRGYGMFTVTMTGDDTPLGLIGPWFPEDWPETEIGWMLFEQAEGKGIAFEAAAACVAHAYDTLGWDTAVSYVGSDNPRSQALAERLGASVDDTAPQPDPDHPVLVYRHPMPEAA